MRPCIGRRNRDDCIQYTVLLWQLCVLHNASYNTIMLIVVVLVTSDRIRAIRGEISDR